MSTFTNTAREVEMPNGDVVVIHKAPTGGANTTSNIKKFKYDDNGHVTESTAADAEDLNLSSYSTPTTGTTAIGTSDDVQTAIGKLDHQSHIDQSNILSVEDMVCATEFSSSTAYAVGDMVTYEHKLYKFINAHQGAWSASDVQNYDLTRLEAEDRASLAEVVDSGAKNLIDVNNYSNLDNVGISNGVFTTQGDTLTTLRFDVYLRNGSTPLLKVVNAQSISSNGVYYWEFVATANTNNVLIGHNGGTYNGRATINLTDLVAGRRYVIQVNVTQCQNASGAFKWQDVMICTKAAFGVSQKFVAYKQPERLLIHNDTAAQSNSFTFDIASVQMGTYFLVIDGSSAPTDRSLTSLYLLTIFTKGDLYLLTPVKESNGNTISSHSISGTTVTFNLDAMKFHSARLFTIGL